MTRLRSKHQCVQAVRVDCVELERLIQLDCGLHQRIHCARITKPGHLTKPRRITKRIIIVNNVNRVTKLSPVHQSAHAVRPGEIGIGARAHQSNHCLGLTSYSRHHQRGQVDSVKSVEIDFFPQRVCGLRQRSH
ncbi:hypothetical protein D3C71_1841630 [compost metagenome]